MLDIEGFILVGGASSRMGSDKAQLVLGGMNFVERIHAALSSITTKISLVGRPEATHPWPRLQSIPDIHVKWGALGGLHAALTACAADWAAVVACDLPFVTRELFQRLAKLREEFDVVVPTQPDGRRQPLCALYRRSVCATASDELIRRGERRPQALIEAVHSRIVDFDALKDLSGASRLFTNVNTPEEYDLARTKEGEPKG